MGPFKKQIKCGVITTILMTSFAFLPGCATSVSRLSADGKSDEITFPDIEKKAWIKEGIFPNIDNLRNVAPDMTKSQLYALLGHPHFAEGFGKVREWDYIFNFHKSGGTEVETCQYKIIYTSSMRLQSTYWKPETCAEWLKPAAQQDPEFVEIIIERPMPAAEVIRMQLSADGMFEFDKSEIASLRPGGIEKLNRLSADILAGGEVTQLKIVGHTDRLGDDAYNVKLSEARAHTISQYLVGKNIPPERITILGVGKTMPLVECKQNKRDEALIRCLEPNRRFEIEAWTVRKMSSSTNINLPI